MALSKELVGTKLDRFEFEVERGKIKEFALAIGESNPIYHSLDEAKKAGYEDVPAPLTFSTVLIFWGYPKIWSDFEKLGIDLSKILHLKEEYTYHKIMHPGKMWAQGEITDVKIGKMNSVTVTTTFHNSKNEPVISAEMAIVIRPD
jgi:hypothetical protein